MFVGYAVAVFRLSPTASIELVACVMVSPLTFGTVTIRGGTVGAVVVVGAVTDIEM